MFPVQYFTLCNFSNFVFRFCLHLPQSNLSMSRYNLVKKVRSACFKREEWLMFMFIFSDL